MQNIFYQYHFIFPDGQQKDFLVELNGNSLQSELFAENSYPDWAQLESNQCFNCPLTGENYIYCPVAVSLVPIIDWCKDLISYDEVTVKVISEEREVQHHTSLQRALSSLLGLLMSSSACPKMKFLRPLARFHLPFSTHEETLFCVVSSSLLKNYIDDTAQTHTEILQNLKKNYQDIQDINRFMAYRIRGAIKKDAAVNAIVLLDVLSKSVTFSIDDSLRQLRYLYDVKDQ